MEWIGRTTVPIKSQSVTNRQSEEMAFKKALAFNWDHAIATHDGAALQSLVRLKAKAAELSMKSDKFVKPRVPIDFPYFKSKCVLTKSGYDFLEKLYTDDNIPKFHHAISPLTLQKRAASAAVMKEIAIQAAADIEILKVQIAAIGPIRITSDTTYIDCVERFPQYARQIESEINADNWDTYDDENGLYKPIAKYN